MPDDNVAIQPTPANPNGGPITLIRTYSARNASGDVVETQAVTFVDETGCPFTPMTEATGRAIVALLTDIANKLTDSTGSGFSQ